MAPEVLFNPRIAQSSAEMMPVHETLIQSLEHPHVSDERSILAETVVLSGGTSMMRGFKERLVSEITGTGIQLHESHR